MCHKGDNYKSKAMTVKGSAGMYRAHAAEESIVSISSNS